MFQIYNTPIFAYRLLAAFGLLVISARAQAQNVIINEVSNGASGSKEFVEFLVVGTCGQTADIRGWYFDDNCAPSPTGVGTAPGNARFANVAQWAAIPVGSLIVIYNPADKNAAIPADDPTDADCDLVYILPLSNSGLEVRGSAVGGCGSSNYTATTGLRNGNSRYRLGLHRACQ